MAKAVDGDPYENLANAIIKQAADDYMAVLEKIRKRPDDKDAMSEAMSIEKFFHSKWYGCLTDVDGGFIIRKLREEVVGK